jgi:hypothetical protein
MAVLRSKGYLRIEPCSALQTTRAVPLEAGARPWTVFSLWWIVLLTAAAVLIRHRDA